LRPEPSPSRRDVAVAGHLGDVETARRGMVSPNAEVRATALGALVRIGVATDDDLRAAATDPDAAVRRRAAYLLGVSGPSDVRVTLLGTLLDDSDDSVVEVACFAAGEVTEESSGVLVGRLVELAGSADDALCREAAVAALGSLGDPAGRDAILAACDDRATVRRRAVLALAAFEGTDIDSTLERLTGDRDLQVRHAAEDLLAISHGHGPGASR
jgi:HEAT repeat protein